MSQRPVSPQSAPASVTVKCPRRDSDRLNSRREQSIASRSRADRSAAVRPTAAAANTPSSSRASTHWSASVPTASCKIPAAVFRQQSAAARLSLEQSSPYSFTRTSTTHTGPSAAFCTASG